MPLIPGTKLGPYEITESVGAGGMGEVYRARDERLGRDVAVKVLPASLSDDPAALARFEREARAIGALNHPNIVNIHDVGSDRGISYVVMELVEGETLRARLQGTAVHTKSGSVKPGSTPGSSGTRAHGLPKKKALDIAHQIAQGLAAAHARGIVHRDLKPENIFLTSDGRVKILDFGLARAVPEAVQQMGDAQTQLSPNVAAGSVPGLILGTIGYMAPEQVRGQVVDHRADIFAFGAVLYEMLTGQRAFDGDSSIEAMSAILKADPMEEPVASVAISGPLEPLLRHCLEKQPDERFQSARDLAFQLQAIASGALSTGTAERAVGRRGARRFLLPAAVAAALAAGLAIGYWFPRGGEEESITLAAPMPPEVRLYPGASPARAGGIAVSRDGRQIAFAGTGESERRQIHVRSLDSPVVRAVQGTEGGTSPAWSPDGQRLAFVQGQKLKIIAAAGGSPQVIADVRNARTAPSWGDDDTLLYHSEYRQALLRVAAGGGTPAEVLAAPPRDVAWFSPVWLPDGRRFLIVRFSYADDVAQGAGIYVGAVDSKELTLLVPGLISEVAVGDREMFYRKGTDLVAHPFDPGNATLSGQPRVLSNHVSMVAAAGGTLVYFDPAGGLSQGHRITLFSRTGAVLAQLGDPGTFRDPKLSPDGRFLAIARAGDTGVFSIWTYELARNIDSRVTGATFVSPGWTRDGRAILVGRSGLMRVDVGGSGQPQLIRQLPTYSNVLDTTPDGSEVILLMVGTETSQTAAVALDGRSDPRPIGQPQADSTYASISPDGNWIAMVGREATEQRLFVRPYRGPGARIPVMKAGGSYPRWRGDGRELYFLAESGPGATMMAMPVTWTAYGPEFGTPQELFKIPRIVTSNLGYDVTSDGQKFVAIVGGEPDASPLTVRIRVPSGGTER